MTAIDPSGPDPSGPDPSGLADRLLIRELIDAYSNVVTQRRWDLLPDLWAEDCAWRTRGSVSRDIEGKADVVAAVRAVVEGYRMVFQMPHAPRVEVDGDTASVSVLVHELVKVDDVSGRDVFAIYHDRVVRTAQGWKFKERVFRGSYIQGKPMPGVTRHLLADGAT
ncbi:MAG TPA: nuclear transport factor 2 family protein [Novosphingobium sp.]|nr:nuclear transport factor 2 family protein [Novosphingobium sp.]